ncbi:MAG: ribosomal L7Ae/L30e/S12e/Gadd45 family protein [Firmicutes bacterium]|nr:ribosomal L7Ae/L30e/S12e/Gadd45 family protein [Bacillota bacterium]
MANNDKTVVIGKRQILRELKNKNVREIRIASDAETQYIHSLIEAAKENSVKYVINGSMADISSEYGIDVPSGAVGLLVKSV